MMQDGIETLVVGADGTLGALLVRRLEARGATLRCKDMAMEESMQLEPAATVINAAGPRARPGMDWSDYYREHIGTSRAIVRAMKPGSHLIHLSSTAVYGAQAICIDSDSPESPLLFPMAAYACAKYASELAVRALCKEKEIRLTVLRLSMVYGPGVDSALDSLSKMAARGLRLALKPQSFRQHFLNIELLVYGLMQVRQYGPFGPRPLILADPFFVTNAEINDTFARLYPSAFPISVPLNFFGKLCRRWKRIAELGITMPLASFAVLAINNKFAWQPAFQALGINPSDFDRTKTLDRYLS
jgi:nucleoside-diphosphate-sugar epimerase